MSDEQAANDPAAINPAARDQHARRNTFTAWLTRAAIRLAVAAAMLGGWQYASASVGTFWLSSPTLIAERLWQLHLSGDLYWHAETTVRQAFVGLIAGFFIGTALGLVLGALPRVAAIVDPLIMAFYSLPRIALAPLFIIWFGIGFFSKVVMVFSLVVIVFTLNTMNGLREIDRDLISLMRTMRASRLYIVRKVQLPSLVPWIFAALKISIGFALIGSVIGELLGANRGLGWYIENSGGKLDTTGVFAGLVALMIVAIIANELVKFLEVRALGAGRAIALS